ncbi:MAG: hypothetical protein RL196_25 [Actinomycetota bacterium]|jgi:uncharacterized protein (DUF885 family)
MNRVPSKIDALAEQWYSKLVEISPSLATSVGSPLGADKLDDQSPAAEAQMHQERNSFLTQLRAVEPADEVDRVTKHAMLNDLELQNEMFEARLSERDLNVIASPAQGIRDIFDLSPTDTEEDWRNLVGRMNSVGEALAGYVENLRLGIEHKNTPARRQVKEVAKQVRQLTGSDGFFIEFAKHAKAADSELPQSLLEDLRKAAEAATQSYVLFGNFLTGELLDASNKQDAVGLDHYQLTSRQFLGAAVDFDETYEWGIEELARVTEEQERVAQKIKRGATVEEAIARLDNDDKRKLHGSDALQAWMQNLSDRAIEELGKTHFEIAPELRDLECMIAPTQSGGIYYTGPTDDFSRPGRMWWSVPPGVTTFSTWRETTTVYHEGVPGHHLQVAQAVYNKDELNSWRRNLCFSSDHAEGWALYAERLMQDLGFLDDLGDQLGMLDGQRMRAARVVLDIGVHLGKPRLDGTGTWDHAYAREFMGKNVHMAPEFIDFEVNRYFGWPGQAPSYKIGQRIWEQLRDSAAARDGANFNIKEFHRKALNLGSLPLDTLRMALAN